MSQHPERTHTTQMLESTQHPEVPVKSAHAGTLPGHLQMSSVIAWILQGGVIISSALIIIGLLLLPLRPGGLSLQRVTTFPHTLPQEWSELLTFHPQAIIVLGLLLLIATPVLRVAASVVAFALEGDRRFVVITLIVLAILIASFLLGKGGA